MRVVALGRTGLKVSRLSIGTDYRSIYGQAELGAQILLRGFDLGVNFWDTADDYGAHPGIKQALRQLDRSKVVIATKTYGSRDVDVWNSLKKSMDEMGTDYLDVYLLHAVDSPDEIEVRKSALKAMLEAKEKGLVKAVGLSTHSVPVVKAALCFPEIEVVLAVVNRVGARIREGTLAEMLDAFHKLYEAGKGVYIMKALGRGLLSSNVKDALTYILQIPYAHSVTVGITSLEELEANVRVTEDILGG